jgi:hypothetical protein
VEKSGIPVAAIVSADDLERLTRLETERAEHFTALDRIREAFSDVPDEELAAEVASAVGLKVASYSIVASLRERGPGLKQDLSYDEMKEIAYENRLATKHTPGG